MVNKQVLQVVYSPSRKFRLNSVALKFLSQKFNLSQDEAYALQRHDERLIQAVKHSNSWMAGMSSLVIEDITTEQNDYQIVGLYGELLVTGEQALSGFPEDQLDSLILHMPISLQTANLNKSCLYDRLFGVFYVRSGAHELVAKKLLELHLKMTSTELLAHLKLSKMTATDFYLKTRKGSCFRSSVSKRFTIGKVEELRADEIEHFGKIGFDEVF